MKLKTVILKNFRCYKEETRIDVGNFAAFIGKNDIGKSSILEALEIFFNSELVKFEHLDRCVHGDNKKVCIGCVFTDFPSEIVIDVKANTTLKDEFLLNKDGDLEIHKIFDCSVQKLKINNFAVASHPTAVSVDDLLLLKNSELKARLEVLNIDKKGVKLTSNPSIRKKIWQNSKDLNIAEKYIPLDMEDAKKIWTRVEEKLPTFALFQADRKSLDADAEVQDPMKLAVIEALKASQKTLNEITKAVEERATEVANRTVDKLREMNPKLAKELRPYFKSEPKWETLFKLSLTGDDQIPINKRGSGVRRLILFNFFRAEAERKRKELDAPSIIYAIEEPETSQHPSNQKMIVDALLELSEQENCQVIITTHVPGIASLLPVQSLRYICEGDKGEVCIQYGIEDMYKIIAKDLGVLPDKRIKVLLCVEGPNDICFLEHISRILNGHNPAIPDISNDPRIAVIPLGGSTLRQWVQEYYLKGLNLVEMHIYDCKPETNQSLCEEVNNRNDGSWATCTKKLEIENYLHPGTIKEFYNIDLDYDDNTDVPLLVARTLHEASDSNVGWDILDEESKKSKMSNVKKKLCDAVASKMTYEYLLERDPDKEVEEWFTKIVETANR